MPQNIHNGRGHRTLQRPLSLVEGSLFFAPKDPSTLFSWAAAITLSGGIKQTPHEQDKKFVNLVRTARMALLTCVPKAAMALHQDRASPHALDGAHQGSIALQEHPILSNALKATTLLVQHGPVQHVPA